MPFTAAWLNGMAVGCAWRHQTPDENSRKASRIRVRIVIFCSINTGSKVWFPDVIFLLLIFNFRRMFITEMTWWKQIIEFKPIDLALLVSGLGVVIWYFVNRHYQKKDSLKAIRLDTYKNFLNKMDEAHYSSRMNFGEIMKISAETTAAILRDPENSNETLIEMSSKLSHFTNESMRGWLIYANEINQLTLVCSKEMLSMVEEYRDLNKQISDNYTNLLSTLSMLDPTAQQQIQSLVTKDDQDRLVHLYSEIKRLMRKEIGN